ncbi:MAG: hypothetical protein HZA22_09935 [Nitrospirae bacterium]|nr:hypothetical protein [Nitrospirota bacterium]MBI5696179.1 hypothetical protein [Nitrospirota bacterium]
MNRFLVSSLALVFLAFVAYVCIAVLDQGDVEPVHIALVLIICAGGVASFHLLKDDWVLAAYYWVIFLWPYLFEVSGHPIKSSFIVMPILCFVMMLGFAVRRNKSIAVYSHPVALGLIYYTAMIVAGNILNMGNATGATTSSLFLWFLGFPFFMLYLGRVDGFSGERVKRLAVNTMDLLLWAGVAAVAVGFLEYLWPVQVHDFYNPRIGGESWGTRADWEMFIDIKRGGSIIGAPNAFGLFLDCASIIAWYKWVVEKKVNYLLLLPLFFVGILVFSNSRAALLIFFVMSVVILFREKKYAFAFNVLLFSLAVFILASTKLGQLFYSGEHYVQNPVGIGSNIPIIGGRVSIWVASVYTLLVNPVHFIYGYGGSNDFMLNEIGKQTAHNVFLTALQFYGVIGFGIVVYFFRQLYKKSGAMLAAGDAPMFSRPFRMMLWGFLISSMVDCVFIFNQHFLYAIYPLIVFLVKLSYDYKGGAACQPPAADAARR